MDGLDGVMLEIHLKQVIKIKVIKTLLTLLEIVMLLAVFIVEKMTQTHALVMRHIYTKKLLHMKVLTDRNQLILTIILVLLLLIVLYVILNNRQTKPVALAITIILSIGILWIPSVENLMVFTYLVGIINSIVALECIKFKLNYKSDVN